MTGMYIHITVVCNSIFLFFLRVILAKMTRFALLHTAGFTKKEYFVEKLKMTVGLVQKNILLIVKTSWAGS
jgi:hypothetical protein